MGAADHGHYYSMINSARGAQENHPLDKANQWRATETDKWMKFDDEEVTSYYFKDLPGEAYGGDAASFKESEVEKFFAGSEQSYGKSAYMLVYEC